jgi:PAS domain S-box-containing protein
MAEMDRTYFRVRMALDDLQRDMRAIQDRNFHGLVELRATEARTRAVVDTAADAVIISDQHGVIESVNPAAERMFGYTADELRGQSIGVLMPPPDRPAHEGYVRRYLETGAARIIGVQGREVTGQRRDGSRFPFEISVSDSPPSAKWGNGRARLPQPARQHSRRSRGAARRARRRPHGGDLGRHRRRGGAAREPDSRGARQRARGGEGAGRSHGSVGACANRDGLESVTLSVADTGPGIDPARIGRIFDLFYTSKPSSTGIGLAIARRLVEAQGGTIEVTSEVERGAVFTVRLPVRRQAVLS